MFAKGPIDPEEYRKKAEEIEAKKFELQQAREEKKRLKEAKKKKELLERLIAPFLLILTTLISYIVHIFSA
ncbi:MAG: hypothetical protein WAU07_03975 [Microgenomates group bacterium]